MLKQIGLGGAPRCDVAGWRLGGIDIVVVDEVSAGNFLQWSSLETPLGKAGGGVSGEVGITRVLAEPKPKYRRDTNTARSSLDQDKSGMPRRMLPKPTLQLSQTVIGEPPAIGTATVMVLRSPCPPGEVTPTSAHVPLGETFCSCISRRSRNGLLLCAVFVHAHQARRRLSALINNFARTAEERAVFSARGELPWRLGEVRTGNPNSRR